MAPKAVLDWLGEAVFKLKPTKCYFVQEEVEYRDTKSLQKTFQVNPKIVAGGLGTILPATSCGLCQLFSRKELCNHRIRSFGSCLGSKPFPFSHLWTINHGIY